MAAKLEPIAREIAVLVRSGYPLIWVVTHEERRACDLVSDAARATRRDVVRWSALDGARPREPSDALEVIAERTDPSLFVLLDFHPYLDEPVMVRGLRERLTECATRRQAVVIVSPIVNLPPELEKDAAVIDLPLPPVAELSRVLAEVARTEKANIEAQVKDMAVRSALGLSADQAARVFRKVIVLRKGLAEDDLAIARPVGDGRACFFKKTVRDVSAAGPKGGLQTRRPPTPPSPPGCPSSP